MSNNESSRSNDKPAEKMNWVDVGFVLGWLWGAASGVAFLDNMWLGMAIGAAIGLVVGIAVQKRPSAPRGDA